MDLGPICLFVMFNKCDVTGQNQVPVTICQKLSFNLKKINFFIQFHILVPY